MTAPQVRHNHNGGRLVFGPDGMLCWPSRRRWTRRARSLHCSTTSLARSCASTGRGGALRDSGGQPQPARRAAGGLGLGLPQPLGLNFDRATGDLWLGDVGAATWELIRVEKGGHYGWPCCEGPDCVEGAAYPVCSDADRLEPTWAYGHDLGQVVVAGPVYHGAAMPDLDGTALVADYLAGWVRGVRFDTEGAVQVTTLVEDTGLKFSGLGRTRRARSMCSASVPGPGSTNSSPETTRARPHRPSRPFVGDGVF